jgi:hypothetical protein
MLFPGFFLDPLYGQNGGGGGGGGASTIGFPFKSTSKEICYVQGCVESFKYEQILRNSFVEIATRRRLVFWLGPVIN